MSESANKANEVLGQLLQRAMDGVDAAVEFSQAQIPDVIEQLLMWRMVESVIWFSAGLLLLIFLVVAWAKKSGCGDVIDPERSTSRWSHKWTLTHDGDGDFSEHAIISALVSSILVVVAMCLINFDWLKIMIAPKLYLLEYAAQLVK